MGSPMLDVRQAARNALLESEVAIKLGLAEALWRDWQAGRLRPGPWQDDSPVLEAGRPDRPRLAAPDRMPRRELSGPGGHAALLHALAHIEFNAVNLALDAVYRFANLPDGFYADWLRVAAEEADHFRRLRDHLRRLGHDYGDLPAHGGLWQAARQTAHDPLARMAVVPRYFEARGLDVTPGIQAKLRGFGDHAGAAILDVILRDEIGHVAVGDRWFRHFCAERGLPPEPTYLELIGAAGLPPPKRPLNRTARNAAGFSPAELAALDGE